MWHAACPQKSQAKDCSSSRRGCIMKLTATRMPERGNRTGRPIFAPPLAEIGHHRRSRNAAVRRNVHKYQTHEYAARLPECWSTRPGRRLSTAALPQVPPHNIIASRFSLATDWVGHCERADPGWALLGWRRLVCSASVEAQAILHSTSAWRPEPRTRARRRREGRARRRCRSGRRQPPCARCRC